RTAARPIPEMIYSTAADAARSAIPLTPSEGSATTVAVRLISKPEAAREHGEIATENPKTAAKSTPTPTHLIALTVTQHAPPPTERPAARAARAPSSAMMDMRTATKTHAKLVAKYARKQTPSCAAVATPTAKIRQARHSQPMVWMEVAVSPPAILAKATATEMAVATMT